ncbi:dehydrase and lipid transport-domain-containing protein [Annulohypoxylon truncatum]|uniref:dehydrase and lipid transport-domain-containing protein n=1 Tax=Annulohypoxylon truncatum TaxID=327061 RepID=UPI002008B316|nr:dehydrase and lipid transport-domain-containing protein [Annulohypoxylon truncatum]KAI1214924.1 dehydrase and lipid transport-domain-containing protein [Annulohypoxylon truncatum]
MSTARTLTPTRRLLSTPRTLQLQLQLPRRTFITLPAPPPQTLTASRRLPYLHTQLYDLIADVDSYVTFLPYCQTSRVTHWTTPSSSSPSPSQDPQDPQGPSSRRWPTRADLTAGWGGFQETYTSRLFCVPALGIVEAISGDARTLIPASELRKYGLVDPGPSPSPSPTSSPGSGEDDDGGVFKSLVTRWTVTPASSGRGGVGEESAAGWSDVRLSIRYQFANPLYMAVSAAVADKVAPVMVEAFVERARRILGDPGKGEKKKSAEALR